MACGSCGSKTSKPNSEYVVTVGGVLQSERHATSQAARIWIAQNVTGQAATVRAVPKQS